MLSAATLPVPRELSLRLAKGEQGRRGAAERWTADAERQTNAIRNLSWVTETSWQALDRWGGGVKDPGPIHICGSKTSL